MKYKVFLILLVSIILVLNGCDKQSSSTITEFEEQSSSTITEFEEQSSSAIIEFEEFDLSDLTMCLDAMMDEDDETVCSQEDGEEYLLAYANNFIQYLDEQATVLVHLSYNTNVIMTIGFDDLPASLSQDSIDVFNQVVERIHFDISDIILNDLGYVIDFRPEVTFSGVEIGGFSEYYDVDSFQYINRYMTSEIYVAQMTYYEDTVLTDNFDDILDRLEEVLEEQSANYFIVQLINVTEYVRVEVNVADSEFRIFVGASGFNNTTELTASDFLNQVQERFPEYTYQDFE